ncbi:MAG: fatty acid desaturase [Leptolyngbyaceae cyanobacterium SM2_3_12]|nr:fatty acid desaturase [Leptolyngbyaceae cyanobacterium SM2_3_12]
MQGLISQAEYAKRLRPYLPAAAFEPDPSKLWLLLLNLLILGVGWAIGAQLDSWPRAWLWLYVPVALGMGNSIVVIAFTYHDLMHGSVVRNRKLTYLIALVSQVILWTPPTLWAINHNRVHHNQTNSLADPDRNYLYDQPNTIGKRVQSLLVPSSEVAVPWLVVGLASQWVLYAFRNLGSALLFGGKNQNFAPATVPINAQKRWRVAQEFGLMVAMHLGVLAWLSFDPLKLLLAYGLPLAIGYGGMIAYIYTNHLASPMTDVNDPLVNSISLRMPKFVDVMHLNFSYHAEHHIFPGLNSDYYPAVQTLLHQLYPTKTPYVLSPRYAWQLLRSTPRLYADAVTLTDWQGQRRVPCYGCSPVQGEAAALKMQKAVARGSQ